MADEKSATAVKETTLHPASIGVPSAGAHRGSHSQP
jgi:hypothetical protein